MECDGYVVCRCFDLRWTCRESIPFLGEAIRSKPGLGPEINDSIPIRGKRMRFRFINASVPFSSKIQRPLNSDSSRRSWVQTSNVSTICQCFDLRTTSASKYFSWSILKMHGATWTGETLTDFIVQKRCDFASSI